MQRGSEIAVDMDPIDFLFSLERFGIKFGLDSTRTICARLGHPERAFPSVIVAGTNGKGSVTAMTATALSAAGHRCGRYTSPHLVRLEERFVIDGHEIGPAVLRDVAGDVRDAVLALVDEGQLSDLPTFFEVATVIAFEWFRRSGVGIAVLEVGLGGRLDATNVVSPVAAAIVSIAFDHQAQLGHTLTAIAREKAGVIKPTIPVVCGPLPFEADDVIADACVRTGARMIRAYDEVEVRRRDGGPDAHVDIVSRDHALHDVALGLHGRHQVDNAVVALVLLEQIDAAGIALPADAIRAGLTRVQWPARLERGRYGASEVLVDAAHNPAGAAALAAYVREAGWEGCTLVFGALGDKDVPGIIDALLPVCGRVVCTTAASPRALPADALADLVRHRSPARPVSAVDLPAAALDHAAALGPRVLVAGSIFLVGPVRDILRTF